MTDFGGLRPSLVPVQYLEPIISIAAAQFTRPANTTQYGSGDLVANDVDAADVVQLSFSGLEASRMYKVRNGILRKSGTSITAATFRLHLFTAAIVTVTNGDNGAFNTSGVADYVGAIDFATMALAFTDGAKGFGLPLSGTELVFTAPATALLKGLLEARGTYTPASGETFDTSITLAPVN